MERKGKAAVGATSQVRGHCEDKLHTETREQRGVTAKCMRAMDMTVEEAVDAVHLPLGKVHVEVLGGWREGSGY